MNQNQTQPKMNLSQRANATFEYQTKELNISYVICEVVVAILAVTGNALVIYVFRKESKLRRRTNYYIVSLACADFLVGLLGIPFAIMASVGLPTNLHACLFTVSLLLVLCTISIFCLVAVSVDRYWAILHPMGYSRNVRTKTALVIISICWFAGSVVGFLPLIGWHPERPTHVDCFFLSVMDYNYLVFLYFGTIITPAILLAAFYAHIYRVVLQQLRQIVVMNPEKSKGKNKNPLSSGGMIRMLGVQQRNEVKATQNLAIIVLFFMICWIPLYTINCIIAFHPDVHLNSTFMLSCIILSHLNSAGNPLLYAYHLKDFRAALKKFFCNLLGLPQECQTFPNRGSQYKTHLKNSSSNMFQTPPKVEVIVKNSAMLASAPAGKLDRSIWNITEDSGRDSGSSQESFKDVDENLLMIRPATPYKQNMLKDVHTFVDDDSDDVFINESPPYYQTKETCLSDILRSYSSSPSSLQNHSKSSPQLSKNLFLIEQGTKRHLAVNPQSPRRLSPYKLVSNLFKSKRKLNRSLSESDSLKKLNGISADYYSVPL